jgi:hypothetical protein
MKTEDVKDVRPHLKENDPPLDLYRNLGQPRQGAAC